MSLPTAAPVAVAIGAVLQMMKDGRFRVPVSQRSFVWSQEQTISLFDSIVAGFPTGAIIVLEDAADASDVQIGPFRTWAPADPAALWLIDGLQRLGTLAGALLERGRSKPSPFRLAYDLDADRIREQEYGAEAPANLLPLDVIADPADFSKWLSEVGPDDDALVEKAVEVRTRILEYPLVLTRITGVTKDTIPEIFVRLNSGTRLSAVELHNARNASPVRASGTDPRSVSDRLTAMGFGRLPPAVVLDSIRSVLGPEAMDVSEAEIPPAVSVDAEKALNQSISWLRDEAAVPHLVVWEQHVDLLPVLARFFHLNRRSSPRARTLLRRWLWRVMGQEREAGSVTPWPISGRDSTDASLLLADVSPRRPGKAYVASIGQTLALSALEPMSLSTGRRLNVPKLLEAHGGRAFRDIVNDAPVLSPPDEGPMMDLVRGALDRPDVLLTHALDREMLVLLLDREKREFQRRRRDLLAESLLQVADGLAEWGASDRPAISDLLIQDDDHGF